MGWFGNKKAESAPIEEQWRVTGIGGNYGSDWTDHRGDNDPDRRAYLDWLGGFFSGLSLAENRNFLREHDFWYVVAQMDAYCAQHPEDQVCHGAQIVAAKLL